MRREMREEKRKIDVCLFWTWDGVETGFTRQVYRFSQDPNRTHCLCVLLLSVLSSFKCSNNANKIQKQNQKQQIPLFPSLSLSIFSAFFFFSHKAWQYFQTRIFLFSESILKFLKTLSTEILCLSLCSVLSSNHSSGSCKANMFLILCF